MYRILTLALVTPLVFAAGSVRASGSNPYGFAIHGTYGKPMANKPAQDPYIQIYLKPAAGWPVSVAAFGHFQTKDKNFKWDGPLYWNHDDQDYERSPTFNPPADKKVAQQVIDGQEVGSAYATVVWGVHVPGSQDPLTYHTTTVRPISMAILSSLASGPSVCPAAAPTLSLWTTRPAAGRNVTFGVSPPGACLKYSPSVLLVHVWLWTDHAYAEGDAKWNGSAFTFTACLPPDASSRAARAVTRVAVRGSTSSWRDEVQFTLGTGTINGCRTTYHPSPPKP